MLRRLLWLSLVAFCPGCSSEMPSGREGGKAPVLSELLSPPASGGGVHRALEVGDTSKALDLLANDPALIDSQDEFRQTPLHVAAHRGRTEAVNWLLAHKAKVNATAYNTFTPLHLARDSEIAKSLMKAGANPDLKDSWGNTALQGAAEGNHQEVVEAILATGYKMDLRTAMILKQRNVVKQMLKDEPSLARQLTDGSGLGGNNTPLGLACSQRDKEIVQLLLDAGADVNEGTFMPNAGGYATALTNAVWAGDKEIVELLLRRGAKTDAVGGKFYPTILDYARKHSSPEIIQLLEKVL